MPEAELRCIVGCNLPDLPESVVEKTLQNCGHSVWTFPQCNKAVITEFPCRSFVSCIIAPGIVYPALNRYFDVSVSCCVYWVWVKYSLYMQEFSLKCGGPILEIYVDGFTQYVAPLQQNDGFFVPEIAQLKESKKSQ